MTHQMRLPNIWKNQAMFENNDILWQVGELGKVDGGGGGTIAKYVANMNCRC